MNPKQIDRFFQVLNQRIKGRRSSASFTFRMHAEHFFKTYGRLIWGKGFKADECLRDFWQACKAEKA